MIKFEKFLRGWGVESYADFAKRALFRGISEEKMSIAN